MRRGLTVLKMRGSLARQGDPRVHDRRPGDAHRRAVPRASSGILSGHFQPRRDAPDVAGHGGRRAARDDGHDDQVRPWTSLGRADRGDGRARGTRASRRGAVPQPDRGERRRHAGRRAATGRSASPTRPRARCSAARPPTSSAEPSASRSSRARRPRSTSARPDGEVRVAEMRVVETEWEGSPPSSPRSATSPSGSGSRRSCAEGEQLAEADRRKDEFLAMLAHELRNPLAPIRNAVEPARAVDLRGATGRGAGR